jgi:hypothetical protein
MTITQHPTLRRVNGRLIPATEYRLHLGDVVQCFVDYAHALRYIEASK